MSPGRDPPGPMLTKTTIAIRVGGQISFIQLVGVSLPARRHWCSLRNRLVGHHVGTYRRARNPRSSNTYCCCYYSYMVVYLHPRQSWKNQQVCLTTSMLYGSYYDQCCLFLNIGSPASRRGRDKRCFHRRARIPMHFAISCFECACVATCCHIFPNICPCKLIRRNCGTGLCGCCLSVAPNMCPLLCMMPAPQAVTCVD